MNINNYKNNIFCILGPTGIGKTLIAMELCKLLPINIISVDSGLIYKELNIGTAKPTFNELKLFPHSLINILDPRDSYSVNKFFIDVKNEIYNILNVNKKIPLLVGGTMMYYNVLFNGLYKLPGSNKYIRKYINMLFNKYNNKYVYNLLYKIDKESAINIHYNDKYRIIRNLEIFFLTNKNLSFHKKISKLYLNFNINKIIILPSNKEILIKNIKKRFYKMLDLGFENEVLKLYNRGDLNINMPSIKCIGYKQMWLYIEKKISYSDMINLSIKNTIFLIKKQITWLKKWPDSYIIILDNYKKCINKIFNFINKLING